MRKIIAFSFLTLCLLVLAPFQSALANGLEDGTYSIQYTVLHADNDSASIANDYWEKPAKVFVEEGKMKVQMTINHSNWVTKFDVSSNGGFSPVTVISKDGKADKRTVEFPVSELSSPVPAQIHVTVEDIDYDHDYTIRFSFDESSLTAFNSGSDEKTSVKQESKQESQVEGTNSSTEKTTESAKKQDIKNPQTSDTSKLVFYSFIILMAGTVLLYQVLKNRNVNGE